jgi:hypothetical protein
MLLLHHCDDHPHRNQHHPSIIIRGYGRDAPPRHLQVLRVVAVPSTLGLEPEVAARAEDDAERMSRWPLLCAIMSEDCTTDGTS